MKRIQYTLLMITLLFAACSGEGIFYNLENEEEILDTNNLNENTSLDQFLLYGNEYVINGKNVWHSTRGSSSDTWETYPAPSGYSNDRTYPSIAVVNDELYATVISHDANYRSGILKYNAAGQVWDEIYYTEKSDADSGFNFFNYYLFPTTAGTYLNMVEYNKNSDYEISIVESTVYFFTNSAAGESELDSGSYSANTVTFPDSSGFAMPIADITYDSINNDVYMIYNTTVDSSYDNGVLCIADGDANFRSFTSETTVSENYDFLDIYYSSNHDMLFIGTESSDDKHPLLYKTGGTWYSTIWDNDVQFSAFCDISSLQSDTILAGTRAFKDPTSSSSILGSGYIEIVVTDPAKPVLQENSFSDDNNYSSSYLADSSIKDIYVDADNQKVYATTTSYGLWLNSEGNWSQE